VATNLSIDLRLVLVVRHGRGRGRHPRYLQALLDDLERRRPEVHRQLVIHETGADGGAPSLDGFGAVVFWLADPLRERFPECFAEASVLADEGRARGLRLVNPPAALSNTVKSTQSRIWQEAGIPSPVQVGAGSPAELVAGAAGLEYPVIVRPDDEHAQRGLRICTTRGELEDAAATVAFPAVAASLVDSRAAFAETAPGTPFARYFHKKRAVVLGDRVIPNELFFSRSPIVASETCTFRKYAGRKSLPAVVSHLLPWDRRCVDADVEFADRGAVPSDVLLRAVHALELDVAAVDYADLAGGGTVIWEANPHFQLPPIDNMYLAGPRRVRRRYDALTDAFGDFFARL
jgi:hypothetical protein